MDHSPLDDLEDYGVSEAAPESDVTAVASPVMSRPGGDPLGGRRRLKAEHLHADRQAQVCYDAIMAATDDDVTKEKRDTEISSQNCKLSDHNKMKSINKSNDDEETNLCHLSA